MSDAQIIPSLWLLLGGVAGGAAAFTLAFWVAELSARLPGRLARRLGILSVLTGVLGLLALALTDPWFVAMVRSLFGFGGGW